MGFASLLITKCFVVSIWIKSIKRAFLETRVGEEAYEWYLDKEHTLPMDFTGRPMKGYVFVTPHGFDADEDLDYWIDKTLAFNPFAKASKKKKVN
ncbi:MAG: hypothetical protein ACI9DJ_002021 [Algoriphagus sp.]